MFLSQSARDVLQARAQWHVSAGSEQICQRYNWFVLRVTPGQAHRYHKVGISHTGLRLLACYSSPCTQTMQYRCAGSFFTLGPLL